MCKMQVKIRILSHKTQTKSLDHAKHWQFSWQIIVRLFSCQSLKCHCHGGRPVPQNIYQLSRLAASQYYTNIRDNITLFSSQKNCVPFHGGLKSVPTPAIMLTMICDEKTRGP